MLMLYNDGAQVHTGYIDRTNVVLITQCIKKQRDNLERQILEKVGKQPAIAIVDGRINESMPSLKGYLRSKLSVFPLEIVN
jgi:hypothetical protein